MIPATRVLLLSVVVLSAAVAGVTAAADLPAVGDQRKDVIRLLGPPGGTVATLDREILQYPRGRVFLRAGQVDAVDLMTVDVFLVQQAREAREAGKAAARAAQRREDGEALRRATIADPAFRRLPAEDRLTFWKEFSADYPEVSIGHTIRHLARAVERDNEAEELRQRVDSLETHMARADRRPPESRVRGTALYAPVSTHVRRPCHRIPAHRSPAVEPEPDDSLRARIFRDFEENRRAAYSRADTAPARREALTGR